MTRTLLVLLRCIASAVFVLICGCAHLSEQRKNMPLYNVPAVRTMNEFNVYDELSASDVIVAAPVVVLAQVKFDKPSDGGETYLAYHAQILKTLFAISPVPTEIEVLASVRFPLPPNQQLVLALGPDTGRDGERRVYRTLTVSTSVGFLIGHDLIYRTSLNYIEGSSVDATRSPGCILADPQKCRLGLLRQRGISTDALRNVYYTMLSRHPASGLAWVRSYRHRPRNFPEALCPSGVVKNCASQDAFSLGVPRTL